MNKLFCALIGFTANDNSLPKDHLGGNLLGLCTHACCIIQVLASQLHFVGNRNAKQDVLPLFWPENHIKIRGHVAAIKWPFWSILLFCISILQVYLQVYFMIQYS